MKILKSNEEIAEMLRDSVTQLFQDQMWSEWLYPEDGYEAEHDLQFDTIEYQFPEEWFRLTGECPTCGGIHRHLEIEHGYTYGGVPLTQPCPVGESISYWDRIDYQEDKYQTERDVILSSVPF